MDVKATIGDFKNNAKRALGNGFWTAFIVCLIVAAIEMAFYNIPDRLILKDYHEQVTKIMEDDLEDAFSGDMSALHRMSEKIERLKDDPDFQRRNAVVWGIQTVVTLLIVNVIAVGSNRFFLNLRYGTHKVSDIFSNYRKGFTNTVVTQFFVDLFIILWSLLLIVPGIIKAYSYFMVPYILAEDPTIDRKRAFEISKDTMYGSRAKLFVTHLSFIGWFFLICFTFGLALIWVAPYFSATMAEFYACMKGKGLDMRIIHEGELPDPRTRLKRTPDDEY